MALMLWYVLSRFAYFGDDFLAHRRFFFQSLDQSPFTLFWSTGRFFNRLARSTPKHQQELCIDPPKKRGF